MQSSDVGGTWRSPSRCCCFSAPIRRRASSDNRPRRREREKEIGKGRRGEKRKGKGRGGRGKRGEIRVADDAHYRFFFAFFSRLLPFISLPLSLRGTELAVRVTKVKSPLLNFPRLPFKHTLAAAIMQSQQRRL